MKNMKKMMWVEIKQMIKLTELRNAEIAFVPWKKEFPPPANAMWSPGRRKRGHKPRKYLKCSSIGKE